VGVFRLDKGEPNCPVRDFRSPWDEVYVDTGPPPRTVLGARQVLLISVDDAFFEEGCDYQLQVEQCVLRSALQPYKCLLEQFDFVFRYITTYPAILFMTTQPGGLAWLE
jgi:hypothetical protein